MIRNYLYVATMAFLMLVIVAFSIYKIYCISRDNTSVTYESKDNCMHDAVYDFELLYPGKSVVDMGDYAISFNVEYDRIMAVVEKVKNDVSFVIAECSFSFKEDTRSIKALSSIKSNDVGKEVTFKSGTNGYFYLHVITKSGIVTDGCDIIPIIDNYEIFKLMLTTVIGDKKTSNIFVFGVSKRR